MPRPARIFDRYGNSPCPVCDIWQPRDEYYKGKTSSGIVGACKTCRRDKQKVYTKRYAEQRRVRQEAETAARLEAHYANDPMAFMQLTKEQRAELDALPPYEPDPDDPWQATD